MANDRQADWKFSTGVWKKPLYGSLHRYIGAVMDNLWGAGGRGGERKRPGFVYSDVAIGIIHARRTLRRALLALAQYPLRKLRILQVRRGRLNRQPDMPFGRFHTGGLGDAVGDSKDHLT